MKKLVKKLIDNDGRKWYTINLWKENKESS